MIAPPGGPQGLGNFSLYYLGLTRKSVQFWLCEACEFQTRQILAADVLQRQRLAFRFVDNPGFMSPSARWRKRPRVKSSLY